MDADDHHRHRRRRRRRLRHGVAIWTMRTPVVVPFALSRHRRSRWRRRLTEGVRRPPRGKARAQPPTFWALPPLRMARRKRMLRGTGERRRRPRSFCWYQHQHHRHHRHYHRYRDRQMRVYSSWTPRRSGDHRHRRSPASLPPPGTGSSPCLHTHTHETSIGHTPHSPHAGFPPDARARAAVSQQR